MKNIATFAAVLGAALAFSGERALAQLNACDLAAPFGTIDSADVQAAVNMTLGITPCTANISGAGVCNVAVVQRVINASLGGGCTTGLGAVPHAVTLTWVASTSPNIAGYNVYRATVSGGPYSKMTTSLAATPTYLDLSATAGTTYYYVTTAVDSGGLESSYSNEASVAVPAP